MDAPTLTNNARLRSQLFATRFTATLFGQDFWRLVNQLGSTTAKSGTAVAYRRTALPGGGSTGGVNS
jgi:hypothetical protein